MCSPVVGGVLVGHTLADLVRAPADEHGARGRHDLRERVRRQILDDPVHRMARTGDEAVERHRPVHDHFAGADAHITHAFAPRILEARGRIIVRPVGRARTGLARVSAVAQREQPAPGCAGRGALGTCPGTARTTPPMGSSPVPGWVTNPVIVCGHRSRACRRPRSLRRTFDSVGSLLLLCMERSSAPGRRARVLLPGEGDSARSDVSAGRRSALGALSAMATAPSRPRPHITPERVISPPAPTPAPATITPFG